MKRKSVVLLILVLFQFIFPFKGWSKTAYAYLEDGVLTFYYGTKSNSMAVWAIPEHNYDVIGWEGQEIFEVDFDPSFIEARPKSCAHWFNNCTYLWRVSGMQYLNTSETTDMSSMFSNCRELRSIDLNH